MILAGIDLAWKGEKNSSAIAVGTLEGKQLFIRAIEPSIYGLTSILNMLSKLDGLSGVAIDAPLIIENASGQRDCEKALSRDYGSRKASCHTSNKFLYPDALSVRLSSQIDQMGFKHLASEKWQIECYPHPAIIECFGLPERLAYKKGTVANRRCGQLALANLILSLESSSVLEVKVPEHLKRFLSASHINSLQGRALKVNEDVLDAIICLYIAALYQIEVPSVTYGNAVGGYIWVPQAKCL